MGHNWFAFPLRQAQRALMAMPPMAQRLHYSSVIEFLSEAVDKCSSSTLRSAHLANIHHLSIRRVEDRARALGTRHCKREEKTGRNAPSSLREAILSFSFLSFLSLSYRSTALSGVYCPRRQAASAFFLPLPLLPTPPTMLPLQLFSSFPFICISALFCLYYWQGKGQTEYQTLHQSMTNDWLPCLHAQQRQATS